jgi:hypothetical protein
MSFTTIANGSTNITGTLLNASNASFTNVSITNNVNISNNLNVQNTITATTFNSLSDYKLKENIIYLTEEFDINNLKPCQFNFINSSVTKLGFIAHEVEEIIPLAVSGKKENIQSVDYTAVITASVITIKRLIERVNTLEEILKKHNIN